MASGGPPGVLCEGRESLHWRDDGQRNQGVHLVVSSGGLC